MTRMLLPLDDAEQVVVREALVHVDREYAFTKAPEHDTITGLLRRFPEADRHE